PDRVVRPHRVPLRGRDGGRGPAHCQRHRVRPVVGRLHRGPPQRPALREEH
ncbi:hypothetical protein BN1708_020262, partial [Verticillium longisporum]